MKPSIFIITTMDFLVKDRVNHNKLIAYCGRTVGYYHDLEKAKQVVEENICDINETCYNYALIQELGPGLYPDPINNWWYKWNKEKKQYEATNELDGKTIYDFMNDAIG